MATYQSAHEFAMPTPAHALDEGAIAAVERMRERARQERVDRLMASVVTEHGMPKVEAFEGNVVAKNARELLALAESRGFVARLHELPRGCMVEGYRLEPEKVGFRAWWRIHTTARGVSSLMQDGCSWHTPWRYEMMADDRPVGVSKDSRLGLKDKRGAGLGTVHLRITGTPWGKPLGYTELKARLEQYDA